ncbi:hypothetical protein PV327_006656 [Microctonus hyperodae]|uniref:Uncharacterized protein n=1 Tax=Microctonus hyperodae TaxID=165561 RepID=A0AA39F4Q3_MICHY|nr:hypothetical protein PV327_006656 [Microctonus hyperodae]
MSRNMKGGSRGKGYGNENSSRPTRMTRRTNDEVQRAIEGLKDIPDDELQEFLDDEEFMQGLNVVDAWDGDEELDDDYISSRDAKERDFRRISRDRNRRDHRGTFHNNRDQRERLKREERRRDDARRDPSKSSKDIERDKMRTKRDADSKILAEKEKAIKHLLDSDTVVPPGTESEAIETDKRIDDPIRRSRERRRSLERHKISPNRRRSGDRIRLSSSRRTRSPHLISPERRRSSERYKKIGWERKASIERRERKCSAERHRRRQEERELRIVSRRSRSRERQRTRSQDRFRRRWSRSPLGRRNSPRRRSISKSPSRRRKRSPFINEITRQFRDEALMSTVPSDPGYMHQQSMQRIQPPPLMSTSLHPPQVQMPPQHYMPHPSDSMGASTMSGPSGPAGPPFIPFDVHSQPGTAMNFGEPMAMHPIPQPDYIAPPVSYNAPTTPAPLHSQLRQGFTQVDMRSPQPVPAPAPMEQTMMFNQQQQQQQCHSQLLQMSPSPQPDLVHSDIGHQHSYTNLRGGSGTVSAPYNGAHKTRQDRLKTPEPPVISDPKLKTTSYPFEKTSLSSLLEASVSAKDSGQPVLYPGFKPEIIRHCELALCDLPDEDPRLKIKGRFFFDPSKEEPTNDEPITASNSILLQKNKDKSLWEEMIDKRVKQPPKIIVETHQKYCQTELEMDSKSTQTELEVADFCVQVCPGELQPSPREEKRPIMDRLDWNVRETYDYTQKVREVDDLRWSLSNSSQKRSWNRGISPQTSQEREDRHCSPELRPLELQDSRDYHRGSPICNRESFPIHRGINRDNFSPHDRYSPDFRRGLDHQDEYLELRSEHSREESPMIIEEHDDEIEIMEPESFHRESSWRGRGKSYGQSNTPHKSRSNRGKHAGGRSFRGRGGGYRGKF